MIFFVFKCCVPVELHINTIESSSRLICMSCFMFSALVFSLFWCISSQVAHSGPSGPRLPVVSLSSVCTLQLLQKLKRAADANNLELAKSLMEKLDWFKLSRDERRLLKGVCD